MPEPPHTPAGPAKSAMGRRIETPAPHPRKHVTPPQGPTRESCVRQMLHEPHKIPHKEVKLRHKIWRGTARINEQFMVMVRTSGKQDVAKVIVFNDKELTVKWDAWDEEHFIRQSDGSYASSELLIEQANSEMSRKARRAAKRLRSRKAVSSEDYGWFDRLIDFLTGTKPPLVYDTLTLNRNNERFKVRFSEEENVLASMAPDEAAGYVLDYTGVKLHIRWENGSIESYRRTKTGAYRMVDDWEIARKLREKDGSVIREKSKDDWFQIWWRDINDEEKPLSYTNVRVINGLDDSEPRVSMDNRILVHTPPKNGWAKVLQYDHRKLHIRWHNKREEIYERGEHGAYYRAK